jgi:hypothetical protein
MITLRILLAPGRRVRASALVAIPRADESGVAYDNSPYLIAQ